LLPTLLLKYRLAAHFSTPEADAGTSIRSAEMSGAKFQHIFIHAKISPCGSFQHSGASRVGSLLPTDRYNGGQQAVHPTPSVPETHHPAAPVPQIWILFHNYSRTARKSPGWQSACPHFRDKYEL